MKEEDITKHLKKGYFRVSVFGSARIKKGSYVYNQVKSLGRMLGERDIDLITGGGPGLMQAATAGHKIGRKRTNAKAIGLGIKLPHEQRFARGLTLKKEYKRFSRRLDKFMLLSNAVVVAPGGIGTILELFYAWQLVQVEHVCNIPIILMGDMWKGLVKWLEEEPLKRKYFDARTRRMVFFAKDSKEVIKMIDKAHEAFNKGDKNFCLNFKKYKI